VRIHWTDTALEHLRAIHTYIARHSFEYAQRMTDRITRHSQQIGDFPLSGRIVPEFGLGQIREVFEGPYRIVYYVKADQIDVLAVIHGSEKALEP